MTSPRPTTAPASRPTSPISDPREQPDAVPRQQDPGEPVERRRHEDSELVPAAERAGQGSRLTTTRRRSRTSIRGAKKSIAATTTSTTSGRCTPATSGARTRRRWPMASGTRATTFRSAPMSFGAPGWSFVANVTTIINPTLTNEFVFGSSRTICTSTRSTTPGTLSKLGVSYKMPYPDRRHAGSGAELELRRRAERADSDFNGTPFSNFNHTMDITDSVAKVYGTPHVQGRHLPAQEREGPDGVHLGERQHLVRPRREQPERLQLGVLQRAAGQLRHGCSNPAWC